MPLFYSLFGCKFVETYIVCMFFVLETSSQYVALFLCLLGIYSSMDKVIEIYGDFSFAQTGCFL